MFYPYSNQLQTVAKSFSKGNFSLWFNKLIPLNNATKCKPCNQRGNDKEAVQYYESIYNGLKTNKTLKNLLDKKQRNQKQFCEFYENAGYKIINYQAELKTPLITGIGQTHPYEIGMVFDHTIGIPYLPASSVKGIVRFAHMLELIESDNLSDYRASNKDGEYIIESNLKTLVPAIFGGDADEEKEGKKKIKKLKGKVIFLDAYPNKVPDLHVDIINPHYGQYYGDDENKTPPADYLDPTPIKFLTVKPGAVFTFKALISKDSDFLLEPLKTAFQKALEDEGVGAKTAVGYGRFEIQRLADLKDKQLDGDSIKLIETKEKLPLDKMLEKLSFLKNTETGRILGEIVNNIEKELKTVEDKAEIAKAIKEKLGTKGFKKIDRKKDKYLSKLIDQLDKPQS
ncbi:MAG: type III-B CRISPR module RAMP protein Cmr6 [Deltaproteobacteria bacterium]|nr:type III-B CRISPR module RAMP protein Cmr6 [Deltaproteobacteria bacterium]